MNQMKLISVLLDLIAKNAEQPTDRFDVPLALYIVACKVNNVDPQTATLAIADSWNDVQLIQSNQEDSELPRH